MNNKSTVFNFVPIISHFNIGGDIIDVNPFGSGHINDTFLVRTTSTDGTDYLLQKINNYVFKDVDGLMNNMVYVTNHLKEKIAGTGDPRKEVLTLVKCHNGKYYCEDEQGDFWRMTCFLKDTRSYDLVTTNKQAYQGGVAFGRFQYLLSDLDPGLLIDTIPDFLNMETRLESFHEAIANDSAGRVAEVSGELEFLLNRAGAMTEIVQLGKGGFLPLRITHNDTKFNNILLDKNNDIQCVIDLDTVMPGYVAYDFGDAIRSIINTAVEDEKNLDLIKLNIPLFAEFTKGYLSETISFLTEQELKSLVKGVLLLPYMQAVRFLTDYLNGDVYYKIQFPEHNLQRTYAQMQLFKMLEADQEQLKEIVEKEWYNLKLLM